jgi:hypothetical protein
VLDTLVGGIDVVADRRANPRKLAGRDRGSDTGAADENAAVGVAVEDGLADVPRLVRVVDPRVDGLDPEDDDLVAEIGDRLQDARPKLDAAVVEGDRDPPGTTLSLLGS